MIKSEIFFIILECLIIYACYKFQKIRVPKGYQSEFKFRIIIVLFLIIQFISKLTHKLNLCKEPIMLKNLMSILTLVKQKDDGSIKVENRKVCDIPIRIYTPNTDFECLPAIIYYHGGGFVIGHVENYHSLNYMMAKKLNMILIYVELAPENEYPIPINDCWTATEYILQNTNEFKIDIDRVALMGDSAGGCSVAVITQRLAKQNKKMPKLQILIYPWMQQFDFSLPSYQFNRKNKLVSFTGCSLVKLVLWYLGKMDISEELENAVDSNKHVLLIEDVEERKKFCDCLDVDLIPDIYKTGKIYYNNFNKFKKSELIEGKLENESVLNKNEYVRKLFNEDVSPGLANDELLKKLPTAYVVVCELDELKDEDIIYAERMRRNGVDVKIAYYEEGYHGLIVSVDKHTMNTIALKMVDDLAQYIKENL